MKRVAVLIVEPIVYSAPAVLGLADILAEAGAEVHLFNLGDERTRALHSARAFKLDAYDALVRGKLDNVGFCLRAVTQYLRFDVIIAVNTVGFVAGWLIKRICPRTTLVSYCIDLALEADAPYSFSAFFSRSRFAEADLFADAERHRAAYRVRHFGLPRHPYVIVNAPRLAEAPVTPQPKPPELRSLPGRALLYAGSLGWRQAIDGILRGLAASKAQVSLYICGTGPRDRRRMLEDLAVSLGISHRVSFLEPRSRERLSSLTRGADMGIAFYPFRGTGSLNSMYCAPSKVFDYMAAGLPAIVSDNPSLREWVEGEGWGICVPPEDPYAVGSAIDRLAYDAGLREKMSRTALDIFRRKYNLDEQARPFVAELLARCPFGPPAPHDSLRSASAI